MTKIVEAIYSDGVLEPLENLGLAEKQKVRLIVLAIDGPLAEDREAALERFFAGVKSMGFRLQGRMPTRDELHDRF